MIADNFLYRLILFFVCLFIVIVMSFSLLWFMGFVGVYDAHYVVIVFVTGLGLLLVCIVFIIVGE